MHGQETSVVTIQVLSEGEEITEHVNAYFLKVSPGLYDTTNYVLQVTSPITVETIENGKYLVLVEVANQSNTSYSPTYFGDTFHSSLADTLDLKGDSTITINMLEVPEISGGQSSVEIQLYENFSDNSQSPDRPAAFRNTFLRRRRTGGRATQSGDEFQLVAYRKTNSVGMASFLSIPQGTYRLGFDYPGIPLDESGFVEFEFGEAGVSDDEVEIKVIVTLEGIVIEIGVLGNPEFSDFKIYPNPASEFLTIENDGLGNNFTSVEILSLDGKVIIERKIEKSDNETLIDISKLTPGRYIAKLKAANTKQYRHYQLLKK